MKTLKVVMLGFGNAGRSFARILISKHEIIKQKYQCDVRFVGISTGSRGSLVIPDHTIERINLGNAINQIEENGRFDQNDPCFSKMDSFSILNHVDYDVAIELTPLSIFTGQPAIDHIRTAMNRGKHVITANKGPIAWAYDELCLLAKSKNVHFYFETTVMDGTPVFNMYEETLKLCTVTEISGILNTTTNFVLDELSRGKTYQEAIDEGTRRGFVEANPSMDIDGWDAAAKTAALLNVLMHACITPKDIDRTGISQITLEDIESAKTRGCVIKLVCSGKFVDGKVIGSVKPTEIPLNQIMSGVNGTSSILSITTDLMGKITIVEHDPEIEQTGYGIFSDLVRLISHMI